MPSCLLPGYSQHQIPAANESMLYSTFFISDIFELVQVLFEYKERPNIKSFSRICCKKELMQARLYVGNDAVERLQARRRMLDTYCHQKEVGLTQFSPRPYHFVI